ncbi:hypothetical protein HY750_03505 [Candidatus Kuenenbacteria bacterium]|nr:hypothetical protein [Candidatus Kuenenbacteria bacterium]
MLDTLKKEGGSNREEMTEDDLGSIFTIKRIMENHTKGKSLEEKWTTLDILRAYLKETEGSLKTSDPQDKKRKLELEKNIEKQKKLIKKQEAQEQNE